MSRSKLLSCALAMIAVVAMVWPSEAYAQRGGGGRGGGGGGGSFHSGSAFRGGYSNFRGGYSNFRGGYSNFRGGYSNYRSFGRNYGYRSIYGYRSRPFYGYGYGYGYYPYYGSYSDYGSYPYYDDGYPSYGDSGTPDIQTPTPAYATPSVPAVLALEFPAPAEVWLDGKKVEGEAANLRTIQSPTLPAGDEYTFHIKARWTVKGQTNEYTRDVSVKAGERSRVVVVSGTAIEEK